jgi:hypothetical protein
MSERFETGRRIPPLDHLFYRSRAIFAMRKSLNIQLSFGGLMRFKHPKL